MHVCMYACMHAGIYHHIKLQQNEKPDKTFSKSKKHLVRIGVGERTECLWWRSHKERCFAVHCTGSTGWNFSTIRDIKTTSCLPQEIRWSRVCKAKKRIKKRINTYKLWTRSIFLWHKMLWQGGTWHFLEASLQHCRRGHTALILTQGFTKTTRNKPPFFGIVGNLAKKEKYMWYE